MISARTQRSRQRGQWAEAIAATYLKAQGLCEIKRNYRCPAGEIDIIMQHQATLVFVEVRYRADDRYGHALETIILVFYQIQAAFLSCKSSACTASGFF
jgi:uncharacterized protein (TIGR00252 family)